MQFRQTLFTTPWMRRILPPVLFWLVLGVLAFFNPIGALLPQLDDLITEQMVWQDAEGRHEPADVVGAPFVPLNGMLANGYGADVFWVRLRIRSTLDGTPRFLRIQPAYLEQVDLFSPDPQRPGQWLQQRTGTRVPWLERPVPTVSLGFQLPGEEHGPHYLRIQTRTNALLQVQVMNRQQAVMLNLQAVLWHVLYMCALLWIVLWALHEHWLHREGITWVFGLTYLVYLVYVLAILGYLPLLLPQARHIPEIMAGCITAAIACSLWFHRRFLSLFILPAWCARLLQGLQVISLIAPVLIVLGHTDWALPLNALVSLLASPALMLVAFQARGDGILNHRPLRFYYSVLGVFVLAYITPQFGWTPPQAWILHGALIHGGVSALLFGHLLHTRSKRLVQRQSEASLALQLTSQQLQLKEQQLAEQERFTAILTHEMKNPMAVIRFNLDAMSPSTDAVGLRREHRIRHALGQMDQLVEVCALADRLEQHQITPHIQSLDLLAVLMTVIDLQDTPDRFQVQVDEGLAPLESDPQWVERILFNLTDNALKYSTPDTPIEIKLYEQSHADGRAGLVLETCNDLPQALSQGVEDLFSKFQRGSGSSRHPGYGLGLYLVKGIAAELQGDIQARVDTDRITFRLWLPLTLR